MKNTKPHQDHRMHADRKTPERSTSPLMKPQDVATSLNISQRSLWRMVSSGRLPQPDVRNGRIVRWRQETIDKWLNSQAT